MDRILAMDRGNDSLKAALMENGVITRRWRGGDAAGMISDSNPSMIAFSSVVPGFSAGLAGIAREAGVMQVLEISGEMAMPFAIPLERPGKVGPDRLCAACGVIAEGAKEAVIVDAGTALTVDLLDSSGFRGGCIFPGGRLLAGSLAGGTAVLPLVDISGPAGMPPGLDTEDAIGKGIFWGFAGAAGELVRRTLEAAGKDLPVYLTGGGAHLLEELLGVEPRVRPDLVLAGIFHLAGLEDSGTG
ncbi:MAG TPA: type III pantothenate kinase [Candidatus Krumholzibacterium sp.]|nr:type III pantothenate kinase [Candidatus Krumholzibacterium sp.]